MTQEISQQTKKRESTNRIPLVTTFNLYTTLPEETGIFSNLKKDWPTYSTTTLSGLQTGKSCLRDRLVSTKFKTIDNTLAFKRLQSMQKTKGQLVQTNQQNHHHICQQ